MKKLLTISILSSLLIACSDEPPTEPPQQPSTQTTQSATATKAETKQDKTFGITPDEYGNRISALVKEVGLGDYPVKFDIQKGEVNDTFNVQLSDAIGTIGTVDKNGELKGITYIMGKTEKGDEAIMSMVIMAGITARALSPETPKEQTAGELVKLLTKTMETFSKTQKKTSNELVVGNTKYTVLADPNIGLWITFSPK